MLVIRMLPRFVMRRIGFCGSRDGDRAKRSRAIFRNAPDRNGLISPCFRSNEAREKSARRHAKTSVDVAPKFALNARATRMGPLFRPKHNTLAQISLFIVAAGAVGVPWA